MVRLELHEGDITTLQVDAIVNAANEALAPGGGVCGAIHRAAGPELQAACRAQAPCPTGEARVTAGFDLPARYVIHAVGPVWNGGEMGEPGFLRAAYQHSLQLAEDLQLSSIAFPAISTGIYGYPLEAASEIAVAATRQFFAGHPASCLTRVIFCCFDARVRQAYQECL